MKIYKKCMNENIMKKYKKPIKTLNDEKYEKSYL